MLTSPRGVRTWMLRAPARAMRSWIGHPLQVTVPQVPAGDAPGQANLTVEVAGPLATGTVEMILARLGREWEVLNAVLVTDGERVPLAPAGR